MNELTEGLTEGPCAEPCEACEDELSALWETLAEGPMHPDATVADLPELQRAVWALTD